MATLEELYIQKREYDNLKEKIESIILRLNNGISCIEDAVSYSGSFKLDEDEADNDKIISIKKKMLNSRNELRDKICPAINNKIKNIQSEIYIQENV